MNSSITSQSARFSNPGRCSSSLPSRKAREHLHGVVAPPGTSERSASDSFDLYSSEPETRQTLSGLTSSAARASGARKSDRAVRDDGQAAAADAIV